MVSKSDFHFPRRTTPFLDCISLWSVFQPSAAIFYLFAIQVHLYKSQSWQSISFKKYKRERKTAWSGLVLVCTPEEQRKVFSFPRCCNMVSHRKSYTDVLPEKSGRSLALCCICIRSTGSSFLPCGSRGVILLTNQWFSVLHYPQIALLPKNVIICFFFDGLINGTGFGQHENKVVALDCQIELPQGSRGYWARILHSEQCKQNPLSFVLVTVYSVPLLSAIANPWISVVLSSSQWQVPHTARQLFTRSLFSCSKGKFPTNVFMHSWNTENSFQPASSASLTKIYFH